MLTERVGGTLGELKRGDTGGLRFLWELELQVLVSGGIGMRTGRKRREDDLLKGNEVVKKRGTTEIVSCESLFLAGGRTVTLPTH